MRVQEHAPQTPAQMVETFVRSRVNTHPFLRNFDRAVREKNKVKKNPGEEMIIDILRPTSQVSFVLLIGLSGSGKTTLADAVSDTVVDASLGMIEVQRWAFSNYRKQAIAEFRAMGKEPTKEEETARATHLMTQDALRVIDEGPYNAERRRRVVIAEMPAYPVDSRQRGIDLVRDLGIKEKGVPYEKRRARVSGIKPDVDVIKNGIITRLLKMSSGGSADMLFEIACKAFAGAVLFRALQPELYDMLSGLIKEEKTLNFFARRSLSHKASKVIAVRMLALLVETGLFGHLDTIFMNPSRRTLRKLSRRTPQKLLD